MTTATLRKINSARKNLETAMKSARRQLLELEVATSLAEIARGDFKVYKSASALMRDIKKAK